MISSLLCAIENSVVPEAEELTRLDQLQVWVLNEEQTDVKSDPTLNIESFISHNSQIVIPVHTDDNDNDNDNDFNIQKRQKLSDEGDIFSNLLFQPVINPTPIRESRPLDDSILLTSAQSSSVIQDTFDNTPDYDSHSPPMLNTQAHFMNWYADSQPDASQYLTQPDHVIDNQQTLHAGQGVDVEYNEDCDIEHQSHVDIECDNSDGDEHDQTSQNELISLKQVNKKQDNDVNTTSISPKQHLFSSDYPSPYIPAIDVCSYIASQSQMVSSGTGPGEVDALLLYHSPTDAKIDSAPVPSSSTNIQPTNDASNIDAINHNMNIGSSISISISNSNNISSNNHNNKCKVNIENPQDPLYLSHWPTHIWPRTTVLQPLPPVEEISKIFAEVVDEKPAAVVYLCQHTIRRESNFALEMSLWLASKLKLPLLVLTVIDECELEDFVTSTSKSSRHFRDNLSSQSFERKSTEKLSRLVTLQQSLASIHVPLIVLSVSSNTRQSLSALYTDNSSNSNSNSNSSSSSNNEKKSSRSVSTSYMEAISSLSTSITIATIFTDDCGHPAHEANCRLLHHWLPSIPLFMVDSDSIVLPKLVFGNLTSIRDSNTATDEAAKNKSSANDDDRQSFDKKLLVGELRRILSQSTTAGRVYMIESEPISDLQLEIASKLENQIRINIQAARSGGVNIIDWSSLQSVLNSTTSSQISTHQDIIKSYSDNRSTVQKPTDRRRSYEFSTRSTFTAPTSTATNTISNGPTASTTGATVRPPRVSFDTSAKPDSYGQQKSSYSSIKTSVAVKAVQVPSQLAFIEQKMKLENLHSQSIHEHNVSDVLQYISTYFESLRHDPHISVNNADSTSINIIGDTFEVIQEVKCWVFSLLRSGVISSSVLLKYIAYLYFEYVSSSSSVSDSTSNKLPSIVFPITTGTADDSTNNNTTSSSVISNHYDTYILYCDDDKLQFNHSRIDHFLRIIIGDNHSVSSAPLSSINSLSTHTTIADSSSSAVILMICSLGRVIADGEWSRYLSVSQLSDSTIRSLFQSHAQLLTTVAQDKAKHANGSNKCRIIELGDVDIQWANLLPTKSIRELTRLEEILRVFNAAFRKVKATTISDTMTPSITTATTTATTAYSAYSIAKSMIENRFYPGHLMSQDNTEPLFHGLHTTLVHSGTVPLDILLDYYISYLMLRSATPEQGLKVAILEISTHAKSFVYEDALLIPYVLHRVAQYTLPGIYDIITTLDLTSLESFIAQTKVSTGGKASSVHDIHSSTVEVNSDQQARVLHSVTPMHPAIPQRVNQVSAGSYTNRTNTMSTSVSSSHSNVIAGKYPTALHTATRNDNDTVSNNSVSSTIAADFDISTRILAALRKRVEEAVGEIYVTKIKFAGQSL